jgi:hypothetical protein
MDMGLRPLDKQSYQSILISLLAFKEKWGTRADMAASTFNIYEYLQCVQPPNRPNLRQSPLLLFIVMEQNSDMYTFVQRIPTL